MEVPLYIDMFGLTDRGNPVFVYHSTEKTQVNLHDQDNEFCRVEKCILLGRQGPKQSVVESYESFEWIQALSSRTGCTSGHKHCRVDNEFFRVEKCISLGRQGPKQSVVETNTDSTKTVTVILHCTAAHDN